MNISVSWEAPPREGSPVSMTKGARSSGMITSLSLPGAPPDDLYSALQQPFLISSWAHYVQKPLQQHTLSYKSERNNTEIVERLIDDVRNWINASYILFKNRHGFFFASKKKMVRIQVKLFGCCFIFRLA